MKNLDNEAIKEQILTVLLGIVIKQDEFSMTFLKSYATSLEVVVRTNFSSEEFKFPSGTLVEAPFGLCCCSNRRGIVLGIGNGCWENDNDVVIFLAEGDSHPTHFCGYTHKQVEAVCVECE